MAFENSDDELRHFRAQDLRAYMLANGYSQRGQSAALVTGADGRVYRVAQYRDGWRAYINGNDNCPGVADESGGRGFSIIELYQRDHRCNLGHARRGLRAIYPGGAVETANQRPRANRPASHSPVLPRPPAASTAALSEAERIAQAIQLAEAKAREFRPQGRRDGGHLAKARGIPADVQAWAGVCYDRREVAYLPSYVGGAITSWESWQAQPDGSTRAMQMAQGVKGLGLIGYQRAPSRIVLCESGIDALSYATDDSPDDRARTCYVTVGGRTSEIADAELARFAAQHGGARVIIATDADEAGDRMAEHFREIIDQARGAQGGGVERDRPEGIEVRDRRGRLKLAKDWNDHRRLRAGIYSTAELVDAPAPGIDL